MSLFLKDFSIPEQESVIENKEEKYLKEIQALKQEIERLKSSLVEERESAYQKGLSDGKSQGYNLAKEEYENLIKKVEEEKSNQTKEALKDYLKTLEENIENLKTSYKNIILQTAEIISDSIVEILGFLYIHKGDKDTVYKQINQLLEEFFDYPQVYIKVGNRELAEMLRAKNFQVETDDSLKGLDFVVDFREFRLENSIQEKLRIIKDEIKREIKKLSEV